jgi:hypothetical protein
MEVKQFVTDKSEINRALQHGGEVLFIGHGGYAEERESALRWLIPGRVYNVSHIEVGQSRSRVELADFPGVWFNTVMFVDWSPDAPPLLAQRDRLREHVNRLIDAMDNIANGNDSPHHWAKYNKTIQAAVALLAETESQP